MPEVSKFGGLDSLFFLSVKIELSDLVIYLSEEKSSHIELTTTDIKKISESI